MKKHFLLATAAILGLSHNVHAVHLVDRMTATDTLDFTLTIKNNATKTPITSFHTTAMGPLERETDYKVSSLIREADIMSMLKANQPVEVSISAFMTGYPETLTVSDPLVVLKTVEDFEYFQGKKSTIEIISANRSTYQ